MKKKLLLFILISLQQFTTAQDFELVDVAAFSSQRHFSNSASWADFDNDGDLDLFVTNGESGNPNEFYINEGLGQFRSVSNILTEKNVPSFSSAWGDYDNDGFLDLYVANCKYNSGQDAHNALFRNKGDGTFETITDVVPVTDADGSYACSWVDYDNDGWLDLFVVNAYERENKLYKNNGDGTFTRILEGRLVTDRNHNISCSWSDYDNDGDVDVFVVNTDYSSKNEFYTNNGDGTFTKTHELISALLFERTRAASWADFNNDGWMDLIIVDGSSHDRLFKNDQDGSFTEVFDFNPSGGYSGNACQWGDYDNDGDLDLILLYHFEGLPEFHQNNGDGSFTRIQTGWNDTNRTEYGWSLSSVDVNLDGRLDIFQTNRFEENNDGDGEANMLFLNSSVDCNDALMVSLRGTESNSFGFGARVRLYASNSEGEQFLQKREMSCLSGGGYTTQSGTSLHFGLADYEQIDSIVVYWPSGIKTLYDDVPLNKHTHLYEDGSFTVAQPFNRVEIVKHITSDCPGNIDRLTAIHQIGEVSWFKNDELISNETSINIPLENEANLYVVEDACERRDSLLIENKYMTSAMYPNPAYDVVNVVIAGTLEHTEANIKIYDASAKLIRDYTITLEEGFTENPIPVDDLDGGTYMVIIESGCWKTVEKLVVVGKY